MTQIAQQPPHDVVVLATVWHNLRNLGRHVFFHLGTYQRRKAAQKYFLAALRLTLMPFAPTPTIGQIVMAQGANPGALSP
jgi:hypothetical protein